MNVLSLFDGASCAMVCLKRAGIPIDTYYGADIKKAAIRCEELISEYYGVKHVQLGDVTKIDYSQLPKIDLLCAGFPCQDYSVVNSRKQGINGKNGQLFWEVVRAIKAVKPKYIILENVTTIPPETLKLIQRETGCFENRIVDPVALGWATRRKRLFFTNWLTFTDQPVPRATKETLEELLDDDAKVVMHQRIGDLPHEVDNIPCQTQQQARLDKIGTTNSGSGTVIKRLDRHGLHDVTEIPCQQQAQALSSTGKRNKEGLVITCVKYANRSRELVDTENIPTQMQEPALTGRGILHKEGTVIGVLNRSRDKIVYSDKEIATLVQNQPTRAGEGVLVLTNDESKTPYKRKKIESVFEAGYTAFRCPTQAELARFHTYPVEIMEKFSAPQAQSLMGDGWHCGSIQWLFDKLAKLTNPEPKE